MKKKWFFVLAPVALVAFVWIGGEVVMHLWNWLLPPLFGWRMLTFWQAVGLLALCRILFGGLGGHGGDRGPRRWRWERMTPEREKFRQRMRARCGLGSEAGGASSGGTGVTA
jgi:hypothetical protein